MQQVADALCRRVEQCEGNGLVELADVDADRYASVVQLRLPTPRGCTNLLR